MRTPEEIVSQPLSDILDTAQKVGNELATATEDVQGIERELVAADKVRRQLAQESKLISNFAQAMLRANGNPEKQEKVQKKYLAALTKNHLARQEAEAVLQKSRASVTDLIADITKDVIAEHQDNKTQPEPVVFTRAAIAGTVA